MHRSLRSGVTAALLAVPAVLGAQQLGAIRGTVIDTRTRRPVPNVTVDLDMAARTAISDSDGTFRFAMIPEGLHNMTARRLGFVADREVNIRVVRDKTTILDIALE